MSTHSGPITSWCVCVSICMRVCAQSAIQYRLLIFPSLCVLFLSLSSALTYNCSSMPLGPSVSLLHRRINSLCSVPCACVCPPPIYAGAFSEQSHFEPRVSAPLCSRHSPCLHFALSRPLLHRGPTSLPYRRAGIIWFCFFFYTEQRNKVGIMLSPFVLYWWTACHQFITLYCGSVHYFRLCTKSNAYIYFQSS